MAIDKCVEALEVCDLIHAGIGNKKEAAEFCKKLTHLLNEVQKSKPQLWSRASKELLTPSHPFSLHQLIYYAIYKDWNTAELGPPLAWIPSLESARFTNLGSIMEKYGRKFLGESYRDPLTNFKQFHELSVDKPQEYWEMILEELDIPFVKTPALILDLDSKELDGEPCPGGLWLPGAILNAAESCLMPGKRRKAQHTALIWRDEGEDEGPLRSMTLSELRSKACQVANALERAGFLKGDAIAINMPMTSFAVVVYLGIVLAGGIVVSIADSFAACEIENRLKISKAKGIFTQDIIVRGGKELPLYNRVVESGAPKAIVVPGKSSKLTMQLREQDLSWDDFLLLTTSVERPDKYKTVALPGESFSNILFSSGTTGEPKAIPWTHLTPIKAAADAWAHHDIRAGDVVNWPTNLGWMMGPWVLYAALTNGATLALYNGSPLGHGFAKFVQDSKTTMLGVVPSIVRHWKQIGCVDQFDWSHIRCFSSTGEASTVDDYLWLMSKAAYKPVIEYCGGTEIGGAFATGSMLQPQALATFSTPAMGCQIFILDETGHPVGLDKPWIGECALDSSILGSSRVLLNGSHFNIYYKGMPVYNGKLLRRHGDEFERMMGGYYKAHGRVDDTMNLGGIKISSVEIERVCNLTDERILETAAVGLPPAGGGPEELLIVAVPKKDMDHIDTEKLKSSFNFAIQRKLNPLFKVKQVLMATSLPRTASNKVMRRKLRSERGFLVHTKSSI